MPTVVGVTVTDSGVEITYNESALSAILDQPASNSATETETRDRGTSGENEPTTQTQTPTQTDSSRAEEAAALIHARINQIRSDEGLHELGRSEELDEVAQYHSDDMAEEDYFSHTSPGGETLRDRYRLHSIGCAGGENIFRYMNNYGASPESVEQNAVEGWMESTGHRENILRPRFSFEGIGVTYSGNEVYVTQNFC